MKLSFGDLEKMVAVVAEVRGEAALKPFGTPLLSMAVLFAPAASSQRRFSSVGRAGIPLLPLQRNADMSCGSFGHLLPLFARLHAPRGGLSRVMNRPLEIVSPASLHSNHVVGHEDPIVPPEQRLHCAQPGSRRMSTCSSRGGANVSNSHQIRVS